MDSLRFRNRRARIACLPNNQKPRSVSSRADRSYVLATASRSGYFTEGQCCSGTHLPFTCTAPTDTPQRWQVWTAHCSLFLFRVRTACKSSLNSPSHGFTGVCIIILSIKFRCRDGEWRRQFSRDGVYTPDQWFSNRIAWVEAVCERL